MFRYSIIASAILLACAGAGAGPAEAKIACSKGFQTVSGSLIATPYCQDQYVAQVARGYGIKVTDEAIRNNPNLKRYVCQTIGRDNRVHIACIDANSYGRRGY
ncbi:MAG: hypothetical protein ABL894_10590 [Hyphomicrobium sp.]